jgi:chaperonin cofactor prefoldin
MEQHTFKRSHNGAGVINSDISEYKKVIAKKKQDKYIKGLQSRIESLESAVKLLEKTVKEMSN